MGQRNGATSTVLHFVTSQDLYRDPATVGIIGANVPAIHQPSGLIYGLLLAHMINLLIMAADQKRERPPAIKGNAQDLFLAQKWPKHPLTDQLLVEKGSKQFLRRLVERLKARHAKARPRQSPPR